MCLRRFCVKQTNLQQGTFVNPIKILLIAAEGKPRDAYRKALDSYGVSYEVVSSPDEVTEMLVEIPFNGLLLDLPTMIKSQSSSYGAVQQILKIFPALRLLYNPRHGGVRGLPFGGTVKNGKTLMEFLSKECVPFTPRTIRSARRSCLCLNVVLLDRPDQHLKEGEKTVTANVSRHGCFVLTSRNWDGRDKAWLAIRELGEGRPIEIRICWQRKWGETTIIPGIGCSFVSLTDDQEEALASQCGELQGGEDDVRGQ